MRQEKHEKWKSFTLAFLLTLGLLSFIMVAAVMAVQPGMPQNMSSSLPPQEQPGITFRPQASDTLTLVVIGTGKTGGSEFLLMRFNPQYGQVPLALLPPQTLVTIGEERMTLEQVYSKSGAPGVKQALSQRLGIHVDRYAKLTTDGFIRVAEKAGSVVFTLPYEINYTNEKGYTINLPAGERRLDGKDIIDIFAYPALKKDELEKSKLLGDLVAAVVNQNLSAAGEPASSGLFKLAVNLIDTDVSFADYEYRRDAADFMSKLETQVAGNLAPQGVFLNDGTTLELSESYVGLIQQYFQAVS